MVSNRHSAIESNNAFTAKVGDLVREIVIQNNILYYRIESSLEHHANGSEDNFMPVIRVITYFEDTVSQIADLLNTEFEIIAESSVDKKKSSVESFSYKHIQYLVGLKANRRELIEYKRSGDKKFEIQICSMLQDAWAGIEKELGYDSASFPEEGKRDLYRVGALLEMADLEFLKIRSKFINEPVVKPQAAVINEPAQTVVAEPTNTIPEQPQEVAQPEAIAEVIPVVEAPKVIIDDIPEPVFTQHEEIQEVIAAPIIEEPEVIAQVVATLEPEYKVDVPAVEPVAQQPAPQPAGIAPKRTKIDVAETIASAVSAAAAYFTEHKNGNSVEKAPAAPVAEQPSKSIDDAEPHMVNIASKSAEPEVAPLPKPVQQTINVEQLKVNNVENLKVNLSGSIEKATEINAPEESVPFFEDLMEEEQTKTVKPTPLDENAPITDASLKEYVLKSKLLKEVDKQIAERAGAKINQEIDIEGDVERLRFLKVYTLKQLHDRIKDNSSDIVSFAEKWIGKDNGGSFDSGISLFYLEYLLVGKKNDPAFAVEYVVKFISDNDYSARYIIPTYNSIRNTEAPNFSHLTLK